MKLPKKALEETYYKTIVSRVTYGISVWGNCSVPLFQRPEAIHARAARFINNLLKELPDEESLKRANWQPLSYIYKRRLLTIMHKVHYNTGDKSIQALFTRKARNPNQSNIKRFNSEHGRHSLRYHGAVIWNTLPDFLKNIDNISTFKNNQKRAVHIINNIDFIKGQTFISNRHQDYAYF